MSGLNPRDIIREVKAIPTLYDFNQKEFRSTGHKRKLWMQVAENVTPPEDWDLFTQEERNARMEQVHTKWKNLRDHFSRVIKQMAEDPDDKRPPYKHYEEMEFMRPFVGYKPPLNRSTTKLESIEIVTQSVEDGVTDLDMEALLKTNDLEEDVETPNKGLKRKIAPKAAKGASSSSMPLTRKVDRDAIIKNFDVLRKISSEDNRKTSRAVQNPSYKIRDGDISFCLSLVPNLRKLGDSKKLRAKIEILKVLQKYNDDYEKSRFLNRSGRKATSSSQKQEVYEESDGAQEDHLDDLDDSGGMASVKSEHFNDPLIDNGNTKTWWT